MALRVVFQSQRNMKKKSNERQRHSGRGCEWRLKELNEMGYVQFERQRSNNSNGDNAGDGPETTRINEKIL